jgi:hypothetical protein
MCGAERNAQPLVLRTVDARGRDRRDDRKTGDAHSDSSEIALEEVEDALAATPAEWMQALIVLLDSVYELWVMRGLDRDEGFCRFPGLTQQRRRGLCSDRRNR